jgi:hypothetical protein
MYGLVVRVWVDDLVCLCLVGLEFSEMKRDFASGVEGRVLGLYGLARAVKGLQDVVSMKTQS